MPKFTKSELEQMANGLGDADAVQLFDQDELNHIITERLAKEAKKHESTFQKLDTLKAELEQRQAELDAINEERENKNRTEQEKWEAELSKRDKAISAWKQQVDEMEKAKADVQTRYQQEIQTRELQAALLRAGAAKEAIAHASQIAGVELATSLQFVEENGGRPSLTGFDPLRQETVDLESVIKPWLDKNPHFVSASPPGIPNPGAGPQNPKPDHRSPTQRAISEGKTPGEVMRTALLSTYGGKRPS